MTTAKNPDPRAITTAQAILEKLQAELETNQPSNTTDNSTPEVTVILHGSRARGDQQEHNPGRSDLDLLVVSQRPVTHPDNTPLEEAAEHLAEAIYGDYGDYIEVSIAWDTIQEDRDNRQYYNSLESEAHRKGIYFPPETKTALEPADPAAVETEFSWKIYDIRIKRAQEIAQDFAFLERGGYHGAFRGFFIAQGIRYGIQALTDAAEQPRNKRASLRDQMAALQGAIPEVRSFQWRIDPGIYEIYLDDQLPHTKNTPRLTDIAGYSAKAAADLQDLIDAAQSARARHPQGREQTRPVEVTA